MLLFINTDSSVVLFCAERWCHCSEGITVHVDEPIYD